MRTERVLSVLDDVYTYVFLSIDRFCQHNSIATVQYAVTKAEFEPELQPCKIQSQSCVVEINIKAKVEDGIGPRSGTRTRRLEVGKFTSLCSCCDPIARWFLVF